MVFEWDQNAKEASDYFPVFNFKHPENTIKKQYLETRLIIPNDTVAPPPQICYSFIWFIHLSLCVCVCVLAMNVALI